NQNQLYCGRPALPAFAVADAASQAGKHGYLWVAGTNRSTGPVTVTVTGKASPGRGTTRSAVAVTRTVVVVAVRVTTMWGLVRTALPIWASTWLARCCPAAAVPPWTRAAARAS